MRQLLSSAGMALLLITACDSTGAPPRPAPSAPVTTSAATSSPPTSATSNPALTSSPAPQTFRAAAAQRTVDVLAGEIGPRETTTASYRRAASWVSLQFTALG